MSGLDQFKAFVEEVRGRSELTEIVGRDIELRRAGNSLKGLSPFHPEKHPSFVVWPASQTWHDYSNGGGLGGDVFTYVQERDKVGFKEAVFLLADRAGVRRPNQDDASWKRGLQIAAERREIERLLTTAATYFHRSLPAPIRDEYFKQHYGFTDDTIDQLRLGWADGHLFEHLTTMARASKALALKTGLFVVLRNERVVDLFRNRLVFPYWRGGRVVYFTARATEYTADEPWEEAKYKKLLTHSERHSYVSPIVRNDYFYNEDAARGAEELVITEGTPDCISAMQAGVACISTSTTNFRDQDLPRLLELSRHAERIIICNDTEKSGAGEAAAAALAFQLWAQHREVYVARIPRPEDRDKIDINELVVAQGAEALRAVLAQAKGYPEYLLDRIPADAPTSDHERLLEPVLASLIDCSTIRADAVLDAITAKLGVRRKALIEARRKRHREKQQATEKNRAKSVPPGSKTSRPTIQHNSRPLEDIIAEAWSATLEANRRAPEIFLRGGSLVRLGPQAHGRNIEPMTEISLFGHLATVAYWVRSTEDGESHTSPSKDAARVMFDKPAPDLPVLDSVVTTPVFAPDGSLVSEPGYHAGAQVWYEPPEALHLPPISARPTPDDVAAARGLLLDDLLSDFPFVDGASKAHMVAALMLPFARRLIPGSTPIHLFEAPTEGSGKGLLVNLIAILATGVQAKGGSIPDNEDEIRKKLGAELSTGRPLLVLDNADNKRRLASSALASATTMWPMWTDRLLGHIKMFTVPNQVMWILTGNNPRLSRELARRCVSIRIDPRTDRPWLRTRFRHEFLLDWASEERSRLLHAVLVLIQNWIAHGKPPGGKRLGTFERWAQTMGGILAAAQIDGFLGNLETLYATADAEGTMWREFVTAWWEVYRDRPVRVSELVDLCTKSELMTAVLGDGTERSQSTRLGKALQNARDRVFGNHRIEPGGRDSDSKRPTYRLAELQQHDLENTNASTA